MKKINIINERIKECKEGLAREMNVAMYGDYKVTAVKRSLLYRFRYWLARVVLKIALKISDDCYYDSMY